MVKYFSVDWLAQSHHDSADTDDSEDATTSTTSRPHVPCMVTPAPPTFGKSCLQPKPSKPTEHKEVGEEPKEQEEQEEQGSCPSTPDSKSTDYSSGEDGKPDSTQDGSSLENAEKQRRVRTKFTSEQLAKLEKIFIKHKYLDVVRRVKTAQKLDLSETQVRTWFQNRRMKMKREMQDQTVTPIPPETFRRLLPLPYGGLAPPLPQYPAFDPAFYYPFHQLAPQPQMPAQLMAHHPYYYAGLLSEN